MAGIPNIGNTCFINSTLQCLFGVELFKNYVLSDKFTLKDSKYNDFFKSLRDLFNSLDEKSEDIRDNIRDFCNNLQSLDDINAKNISNFSIHNDSSELLVYLLDIFEDYSILKCKDKNVTLSEKSFNKNVKKSIVSKNFKIQQLKQIQCQGCGHLYPLKYNTHINIWQLCISPHFINSLFDAIKYDSMTKIMNEYNCEKCKETVDVKERTILSLLPPTLIIQLLRFENTGNKITKNILIPFKLSLDKFSYKLKDQIYELKSICCHVSNNHMFGHYFSIVKKNEDWYIIDDNHIEKIDKEKVKNIILNNAYILFYDKI